MRKTVQKQGRDEKDIQHAVVCLSLTQEQFDDAKELCEGFRLTIPELAKHALFEIMKAHADADHNDFMLTAVYAANTDRDDGIHLMYEDWKVSRAENLADGLVRRL